MSDTTKGPANEHSKAIAMLLLANVFWGLSFPLVKALGQLHVHLDPSVGQGWFVTTYTIAPRFAMALLILGFWQRRALLSTTRGEWRQGVLLGLFAAAGMLFQGDGLRYTEASTSAFLTQLYAISIPLWVALRSRRNPGGRVWFCCLLVLAGVAILGRFDWATLRFGRGEWETLLCSFFFMGQILTLERPEFSANRAVQTTFAMCVVEAVCFWIVAAIQAPSAASLLLPWTSLPWVTFSAALAIFGTVMAFTLMNAWQPKITATEAGLIYCAEPVFGSLMALFLPAWFSLWSGIAYENESASWALVVGGGLITFANILIQLRPAKTVS